MTVRQMTRIAILSSLCVALRLLFGAFPNIKPITAIFLLLIGYLPFWQVVTIASLTMLVTGLYLGFGIWVIWQIVAYIVVLAIWKALTTVLFGKKEATLVLQTILSGVMPFIYSLVMALFSSVTYGTSLWPYVINGLSFDVLHAVSTVCFYPILFYILRRFFVYEKNIF
ncbi:ECF transporter S component [Streptococcus merionis]|uniref:ECF transporter S component n=1 Tax=Streptococcus merionis TaxID=400065 RepID=UPI0035124BF2